MKIKKNPVFSKSSDDESIYIDDLAFRAIQPDLESALEHEADVKLDFTGIDAVGADFYSLLIGMYAKEKNRPTLVFNSKEDGGYKNLQKQALEDQFRVEYKH